MDDILQQCQKWHEDGEQQKIIDALGAIPEGKRTPEMDCELARAYGNLANLGEPEGERMLQEALSLLRRHERRFSENPLWNYRMGYAYFYLNREGEALPYFRKALKLSPGDEAAGRMLERCNERVALPQFEACFRERTERTWEEFLKREGELRRIIDEDGSHERSDELIARCGEILDHAIKGVSFEVGFNGERHELILTPEGNKVRLFEIYYFWSHAPREALERWSILVGRQPHPDIGLREEHGWEISGRDVKVWLEKRDEESFALYVYCEKLLGMLEREEDKVWWMLLTLTDQAIGEIPHMRYIEYYDIIKTPREGEPILLSELPGRLRGMGIDLSTDPKAYLEGSFQAYQMEAEKDPNADWRLDVAAGSTSCAHLVNGYLRNCNDYIDELHANGAAAGFFCYPLDGLRKGDKGGISVREFRDGLEAALTAGDGGEHVTLIGGATGLYFGYVDFIAWDLRAALKRANEFFGSSSMPRVYFHTFRREASCVELKGTKTDGPAEADGLTGQREEYMQELTLLSNEKMDSDTGLCR